jgi:hypothetical protein
VTSREVAGGWMTEVSAIVYLGARLRMSVINISIAT